MGSQRVGQDRATFTQLIHIKINVYKKDWRETRGNGERLWQGPRVTGTVPLSQFFIMWLYRFYAMLCYAKSLQLCPTLCDPIDGSTPDSPVPGILQARTLEWAAISFSNVWKWKVKVKSLSRVRLLATPWIADYQAPPSMGFSKQESWSGVPLPSPIQVILLAIWQLLPYQCFWRPEK